jgi:hypothetical protein
MEVHHPEHGIHSWREFLVHMGTVCVGLLLALGLEQSVIAIHDAHQRADLRAALDGDSRQAVVDSKRSETNAEEQIAWALARAGQVRAALAANTALPPRPHAHFDDMDLIDDAAFKAAKASGLLALLPQPDVLAYSEEDGVIDLTEKSFDTWQTARRNLRVFELQFRPADGAYDFSKATPADLHRYLDLLMDVALTANGFRFWNEQDRGLETALLGGERDLNKLHKAERTFNVPIAALK